MLPAFNPKGKENYLLVFRSRLLPEIKKAGAEATIQDLGRISLEGGDFEFFVLKQILSGKDDKVLQALAKTLLMTALSLSASRTHSNLSVVTIDNTIVMEGPLAWRSQ